MPNRDELSMSTDNTPEGERYSDTVEGGPISKVMVDDKVVDSTGKEIGKVKFVKMGDPNAATAEGQWGSREGVLGLGDTYDISELPEQTQAQLMLTGFIHIDISWAPDKFAGVGMIDRVEGNTVSLNVTEADLL